MKTARIPFEFEVKYGIIVDGCVIAEDGDAVEVEMPDGTVLDIGRDTFINTLDPFTVSLGRLLIPLIRNCPHIGERVLATAPAPEREYHPIRI